MQIPFGTIIGAVLPVLMLVGLGFGLRWGKVLDAGVDAGLAKLVIRVLYPCFFFSYVLGSSILAEFGQLLMAPAIGFATTALGFVVAFWTARLLGLRLGNGLRTFAFCNGVYNYGYIPIPLVLALFGSRETTAVLLVHNIGVEVAIWTAGIVLLSGKLTIGSLKHLINPPMIALLLAWMLHTSGGAGHVPKSVHTAVEMLGSCAIPMGLLLAGAAIADLLRQSGLLQDVRVSVAAVLLRLGLLPLAFLLLAAFVPGISTELKQVMIVQAAMPAGIFPIVIARHYNGVPSVAVKVVVVTTLCAIVTLPLWIQFGVRWLL